MPLVSTRAVVLQAFPYSDTSKVLRLYTLSYGLRSAIAKGAQRPKSRFGGVLEPFTEGEALFFLKEGRELHTLSGFDLLRSRQALGRDLTAFAGASLLAELLLRFGTEEPQPALYRVLSRSLDGIVAAEPERTEERVLSALWTVIALLGYRPETEACVTCGTRIEAGEPARFDAQGGGVACLRCRREGRLLDPVAREELRRMAGAEVLDGPIASRTTHRKLLAAVLSAHLGQEHPFRALELFVQQLS